jgi:hypothetical protein
MVETVVAKLSSTDWSALALVRDSPVDAAYLSQWPMVRLHQLGLIREKADGFLALTGLGVLVLGRADSGKKD